MTPSLGIEGEIGMWKIVGRVAFWLYVVGVGLYFIVYNNGLDTGVPGYLATLQFEWFGSADEKITLWAAVAVCLIPVLVVMMIVRRFAPKAGVSSAKPQADWSEKLLSGAFIVAIVAVSAHVFLQAEIARTTSAKIYQLNLNDSAKLPEDARFANAIGKIQGRYLYVIERARSGRTETAKVYAPFTGAKWTPDQPVDYVVQLNYGYTTRRSADGSGREYSIEANEADRNAARPFAAEISPSGVPIAVARSYAQDGKLKLANRLYLLEQTSFPDGKPRSKYADFLSLQPWLLPAGLPFSAVLLLVGLVGFRWQRRQSAA